MVGHLRIKSPWSQLALFLGLFLAAWLITGFLSLAIYQANGISVFELDKINLEDPHIITVLKIVQALSSIILFILPVFFFARIVFTGNYSYFLGFRKADKMNMYALAIIGILLALPFVFWLGDLNQAIPLPKNFVKLEEDASKQMTAFLKVRHSGDIIINVIIIALLPAIGEELCFRGALQRIMIHLFRNPWAGIIVTAVLFSALHLQFEGFIPRMFLGIVLGVFYWYSGSIWTSMVAHFANNAVQVLLVSYVPRYIDKNPDSPILYAIASGVAVWAIMWYYSRQSSITFAKVYKPEDISPYNQFLT
jgi:uncharacterized protein